MESTTGNARLLTVKQAATYMACTVWFVRSLVWEDRVPHLRFGNRIVFDRADIDTFINSSKEGRTQ